MCLVASVVGDVAGVVVGSVAGIVDWVAGNYFGIDIVGVVGVVGGNVSVAGFVGESVSIVIYVVGVVGSRSVVGCIVVGSVRVEVVVRKSPENFFVGADRNSVGNGVGSRFDVVVVFESC